MKILIVGGGIGGLTLGAFLQDTAVDFEIVEKAKEPQGGFMLVMWDNARDILKKLGLADEFDAHGTPIHHYVIKDGKGRLLRDYNLKDFNVAYGGGMMLIVRKELCEWLTSKIDPKKITRGVTVLQVEEKTEGVEVTFSTGETKHYDAVVGADGVHSHIREDLFKKHVESYENWRSWWLWIDRDMSMPATVTEYTEPKEHAVIFSAGSRALAILTAPMNHTVWDTPEGRIERLRTLFKDETAILPELFTQKQDADLLPGDLVQVSMHHWVKGRVALLGDAAHCFGPHSGLGGSMAMEDAYVLAAQLLKVSEAKEIPEAFKRYERIRRPRIRAAKRLNARMRFYRLIKTRLGETVANIVVRYYPESFMVGQYARLLREEV